MGVRTDKSFEEREAERFDQWFATFGRSDLDKEAQRHGFLGRAHVASKSQNDPSQRKEYVISYIAAIDGSLQSCRRFGYSPADVAENFLEECKHAGCAMMPTIERIYRPRKWKK